MVEDIIVFDKIEKRFPGAIALDDVSFSIKKGEIHTIVGENGAGKSTLMKILAGNYQPTQGNVIFRGQPTTFASPLAAITLGISTVYQELMLCENLSVAENIFLGREPRKIGGQIHMKKMHQAAQDILDSFGVKINTNSLAKDLTVADRQIIEIAKAISLKTDVLLLDEPTSSLTIKETRILFDNLKKLKKEGVTIIFISHRLDEVFEITDRISVLRDGKYLGTYGAQETTPKEIINLIAGQELSQELSHKESVEHDIENTEDILEIKNLSKDNQFSDINFKLFKGEVLGFYGLQGSGRTELVETIFGLRHADEGEILYHGKKLKAKRPQHAIQQGIVLIPEDRRRAGIFGNMDVKDNVGIIHDKKISRSTFLVKSKIIDITQKYVGELRIKMSSVKQMIGNLSGGNQQKVIISRCLSTNPQVLIMDEPTRGIDVGAKAEIYKILRRLKKEEGKAIIVVSSELEEIISECDRVIVMRNGKISVRLTGDEISKENILHYSFAS
jgi:ABC-type sugar transport system ATPase subunit